MCAIGLYSKYSSLKRSGWHVLTRQPHYTVLPATHRFILIWNEPFCLCPSRRASLHFDRYSFCVPLRVGG